MVLRGLVHVDRVLVDEDLGGEQVHLAQDARPVRRRVDDHDVLGRRGPQRDLRGREVLRAPVPAPVVRLADVPALGEEREQVVRGPRPEPLAGLERQLERRGPDVGEQDVEVVRVQPRLLRPPAEDELRVVDHVLVHGRRRGHQHGHAHVAAPPRAAHLLPGPGDGSRVAGEHRHVQAADVDAQLEGVRADDPQHLAVPQAALDRPSLRGQVAAPVAADAVARPEVLAQRLAQVREHDLDRHPRLPEDHGLAPGAQERQRPALGERQGGAARPGGGVHHRRVHEQQVLLAGRRPVAVDQLDRPPGERLRPAPPGSRSWPSSTRSRGWSRSGRTGAAAAAARWRRGEPNTPRYVCSSSITITRSCSNSWNHLVWWGRIAEWSMSGFVTTTCPALRIAERIGAGVSPS